MVGRPEPQPALTTMMKMMMMMMNYDDDDDDDYYDHDDDYDDDENGDDNDITYRYNRFECQVSPDINNKHQMIRAAATLDVIG